MARTCLTPGRASQRRALSPDSARQPQDGADCSNRERVRSGHEVGRRPDQRVGGDARGGRPLPCRHHESGIPTRLYLSGAREPTPEQPFGYGRVRFLWAFIAAIAMFLAGAIFAIGYGAYALSSGENRPATRSRTPLWQLHSRPRASLGYAPYARHEQRRGMRNCHCFGTCGKAVTRT